VAPQGGTGERPYASSLYRASDFGEELARGREDELCRSGGCGRFFGRRLSRGGSMAGRPRREGLVHADEVASGVPADPRRHGPRPSAAGALRQPRLLTPAALRGLIDEFSRAEGFDAVGVTTP